MTRWTLEELIAAGWSRQESIEYCRAYDAADHGLAETGSALGTQPWRAVTGAEERRAYLQDRQAEFRRVEEQLYRDDVGAAVVAEPRLDPESPEYRAHAMARALEAQSEAITAARRAEQATRQAVTATVLDRPGAEPSAVERRAWALQKARMENPPVLRPGDPKIDAVFLMPDGTSRVTRNVTPVRYAEVILPHQWEAAQAKWEWRERQQENLLLARTYGLEQCIREGFIDKLEASLLDPEQARQVVLPPGLEGL